MTFRSLLISFATAGLLYTTALADPLNSPADYIYIMDGETGETLYSRQGEAPMVPASMTKIMTVFIAFERIRDGRLSLDDEFKVSVNAWKKGGAATGGSTMFLEPNSTVSLGDLLRGIIVQSGNDACIVLAENLAGSEEQFAELMTSRARELGLDSATFRNATGLFAPEHKISPHDLAKLSRIIIQDFPEFYALFSEEAFTWNGIRQPNRNPLLGRSPGADGLKTGHLEASGYGLVGSAEIDGTRRIIVINGLDSEADRANEAQRIMREAFRSFRMFEIVEADDIVGAADVYLGQSSSVPLVAAQDLTIPLHLDAKRNVEVVIEYDGPLKAPIDQGEEVARLVVSGPDGEMASVPLLAGEPVERLGLFQRALVGLGMGG